MSFLGRSDDVLSSVAWLARLSPHETSSWGVAGRGEGKVIPRKPAESFCVGADPGSPVGQYASTLPWHGLVQDVRLYWGFMDRNENRDQWGYWADLPGCGWQEVIGVPVGPQSPRSPRVHAVGVSPSTYVPRTPPPRSPRVHAVGVSPFTYVPRTPPPRSPRVHAVGVPPPTSHAHHRREAPRSRGGSLTFHLRPTHTTAEKPPRSRGGSVTLPPSPTHTTAEKPPGSRGGSLTFHLRPTHTTAEKPPRSRGGSLTFDLRPAHAASGLLIDDLPAHDRGIDVQRRRQRWPGPRRNPRGSSLFRDTARGPSRESR